MHALQMDYQVYIHTNRPPSLLTHTCIHACLAFINNALVFYTMTEGPQWSAKPNNHLIFGTIYFHWQSLGGAFVCWAESWQLSISVDKCCVLNIGNIVIEPLLNICGKSLPALSSNRDRGIVISHDLSLSAHISVIVAKAHQRANAVLRAFVSRERSLLLCAYLVYVRPLVENNSVIWSPCLKQDIEAVERVQRRFIKWLPGLGKLSYAERLNRSNLSSLELRKLHNDLIWCYKILFGL